MFNETVYNSINRIWQYAQSFVRDLVPLASKVVDFLFTPCSELIAQIEWLPAPVSSLLSRILPDISVIMMVTSFGIAFYLTYTLIKWFAGIFTG